MDASKLTLKSRAALEGAGAQALARSHQVIEPAWRVRMSLAA